MSSVSPSEQQPTKPAAMTPEEVASYLERAPVTIGEGPDATEHAAARIARKIGPYITNHSDAWKPFNVFATVQVIAKHWLPRCGGTLSADALYEIVAAEKVAFEARVAAANAEEAARNAAECAREREVIQRQRAEAEAAEEERQARTQAIKQLMERIGVSERHAQRLVKQGTCSRERAGQMANVLGGEPSDYLRKRSKTGRPPNLVRLFMRVWVEGCSIRQFCDDGDTELADVAKPLADALSAAYDNGRAIPDHVKDLESLIKCARATYHGSSLLEAAESLWKAYQRWRVDMLAGAALNELAGDDGI
jgi:hypothetical protein